MTESENAAPSSVRRQPLIFAIWIGALSLWTLGPIAGYDFWYYLVIGRDVVENGRIPWEESFLGTTSHFGFGAYASAGWLGYTVCYICFATFGVLGLVLLKSGLLCGTTALVYCSNRLLGLSPFWAGAWASLGLWTIRGRFEMRTYLISDLALALLVLVLVRAESRPSLKRTAFELAALFALWGNLHQGVIAGLLVVGSWVLLGRVPLRQRILLGTIAGGCSLLQPYALSFPSFLRDTFGNSRAILGVVEWAPPSWGILTSHLAIFLLICLAVAIRGLYDVWAGRKKLASWFGLTTASVFAFQAVRSIRSISELLSVTCPLIASWFPPLANRRRPQVLAGLLLAALFLGTFRPYSWSELTQARGYPSALIEAIPKGSKQVFNSFEMGNYLVFRGIKPFIHGMTSLYREQLILDFEAVLNPTPRRDQILQEHEVDTILVHLPQAEDATSSLVDALTESAQWKLLAWDDTGLLFVKGDRSQGLTAVSPWKTPAWTDARAAETELKTLVQSHPSGIAYRFLSQLYLERGDISQATEMAQRAVTLFPEFVPAWTQLGLCYSRSGNLEGLLIASAGALQANPNEASVRFNRGLALWELSKRSSWPFSAWYSSQARYQIRRALWLDPEFAPAQRLQALF